jgi:hypothetical protein
MNLVRSVVLLGLQHCCGPSHTSRQQQQQQQQLLLQKAPANWTPWCCSGVISCDTCKSFIAGTGATAQTWPDFRGIVTNIALSTGWEALVPANQSTEPNREHVLPNLATSLLLTPCIWTRRA